MSMHAAVHGGGQGTVTHAPPHSSSESYGPLTAPKPVLDIAH